MKKILISWAINVGLGLVLLGIGVWYLSSIIGDSSLTYSSISSFLKQIGAQNEDLGSVGGCFLCGYIQQLFSIMGRGTELFWNSIINNLWILMAIGFGIFVLLHTIKFFSDNALSKDVTELSDNEIKFDFHAWFDKVWRTGIRVMVIGVLIGTIGLGGTNALKTVTNITITPVMYIGTQLSMATTNLINESTCTVEETPAGESDILNPVLQPFMCVMGNLNTIMLAGAAGGFALMNYAYMGLGGGMFTWLAGLGLVLIFLVLGFRLVFQVLSVIFKLVFLIIFLPALLAATAFEQVWGLAKGIADSALSMVVKSAVSIIKISLKISVLYAIVYYAADSYFPPRIDGYTSIMPMLMSTPSGTINTDSQSMSVMNVFTKCEQVALSSTGEMNKEKFKQCFLTERQQVEQKYPGAFDFMDDGFEFFLFMIMIYFLYSWILEPKIEKILTVPEKEEFDYGDWVKQLGKTIYSIPEKTYAWISKAKKS
ncbi:MAG: hypothetical protein MJ156_00660 [Alphaproteobacteria bacterium]|nr:hypothetical protein [Alphaproteobacteria bacterium]